MQRRLFLSSRLAATFAVAAATFTASQICGGCTASPYQGQGERVEAERAPLPAESPRTSESPPEFVEAETNTNAAAAVLAQVERARADSRRIVVYVGASWCEPCQHFHAALERGELDLALAGVRFVEFDADRDSARLAAAGYDGRYIPRFALPAEDGTFGGKKIEGGVKGDGAVEHIMNRLGPLLAENPG